MNLNDAFFMLLLATAVPLLATHYLRASAFSNEFRGWVILGGLLWMAYAIFSDSFSGEMLGVWKADGWYHAQMGGYIADYMRAGKWNLVWERMVVGNSMYQCYVGLIMYLTGAGDTFVTALNGWLGYWGGLVLLRHFHRVFPNARKDSPWLLLVIFCPSVIYWTTMDVKEALMYWSICQVFANSSPHRDSSFLVGILMMVVGIAVGSLLRPHIMIPWVVAVTAVGLFQNGQRLYAVLTLALLPLVLHSFQTKWGLHVSVDASLSFAQQQARVLEDTGGGSNFGYGAGGPTFFVSGFIALFFRPFPWQIGSLRMVLALADTWVTTALLVGSTLWVVKPEGRCCLKLSEVQMAILAGILFCVFFSYLPNEGLIVRQRVQAVPALLALVVLPRWHRRDVQLKRQLQLRVLLARRFAYLKWLHDSRSNLGV
ncbi:MAG: hypothetical protein WBG50_04680 [Desulfomonilaceae bacterium]